MLGYLAYTVLEIYGLQGIVQVSLQESFSEPDQPFYRAITSVSRASNA